MTLRAFGERIHIGLYEDRSPQLTKEASIKLEIFTTCIVIGHDLVLFCGFTKIKKIKNLFCVRGFKSGCKVKVSFRFMMQLMKTNKAPCMKLLMVYVGNVTGRDDLSLLCYLLGV